MKLIDPSYKFMPAFWGCEITHNLVLNADDDRKAFLVLVVCLPLTMLTLLPLMALQVVFGIVYFLYCIVSLVKEALEQTS